MRQRLRQRTTPAIAYDTSIGLGVDANGFADLTKTSGARYVFVGPGGNNANTGLSHTQRLLTVAAGVTAVTQNQGDQVLLAEGSSFNEVMPWLAFKGGLSAAYPTVIQSYDPADSTNIAKYGRGDQRNARPKLTANPANDVNQGLVSGGGTFANIAIRGLDFDPGDVFDAGLTFRGLASAVLLENNIFRSMGFTYDSTEAQTVAPTAQHLVIRNNSLYGMWSKTGHTGGIYIAGNDSYTVEDNVIYHAGWRVGSLRDDPITTGGLVGDDVFRHPIYCQTNSNGTVRRNLFIEGAADGGIARGNIVWTQNVAIRCPSGTGLGGGPDYNTERPTGVSIQASKNLSLAANDIDTANPRGLGYTTSNGISGSKVNFNLLIRSSVSTGPNANAFSNSASFNQPSYMAYEDNISAYWNPSGQTAYTAGGSFPAQAFTTYARNYTDDPTGAIGTNISALTFPNAYTEAALYVAAGVTDLATLASLAINAPEQHYQRTLRSLAFIGYGMTP